MLQNSAAHRLSFYFVIVMVGKIVQPEIRSLIDARNFGALRELFSDWPPADIAECITDFSEDEQVIVFRVLKHDQAADVFEYLDVEAQQKLLRAMAHEQVVGILNEMSPDDRTALLEELPSAAARQLIKLLTPEERSIARALLGYPEGSVGRLMTPDLIAVDAGWSVKEVLDYVRENGQDSETLNVIYVVDDRGKLLDDIRMREFLLKPLTAKVSDLMDHNYVTLSVTDSQEDAVNIFRKYDRTALPVVDSGGVLVGIVTIDDMLDIAEEEATEDIQKFGGMEALDEPYMRISLLRMVRKRAGWLVILFLGEMLTASAMGYYEGEIAKAVVLALFLPLIISSGGNSGSQASTLIIRAMALGEVTLGDWFRVMRKEIMAGLMLGCVLGVIGFMRVAVWSQFSNIYGPHWPLVAMTVGFALVGVVLWGSISGSMLPFILRRVGADPATSSAPFVATLVDVTGLIIYFSIALLIMRGAML
ncbi:MAG TPA: magnesium transporter [Chthoniobacterales bacterium]|nr:magnesium transporter [Chthoniobacterales bacterium]